MASTNKSYLQKVIDDNTEKHTKETTQIGHINIQTTQNYYLQLMPEKKHQQDADALNLLNSLSN